jgi:hypothetical protein
VQHVPSLPRSHAYYIRTQYNKSHNTQTQPSLFQHTLALSHRLLLSAVTQAAYSMKIDTVYRTTRELCHTFAGKVTQVKNFHFPFYQSSGQKKSRCEVFQAYTNVNLQTNLHVHNCCLPSNTDVVSFSNSLLYILQNGFTCITFLMKDRYVRIAAAADRSMHHEMFINLYTWD